MKAHKDKNKLTENNNIIYKINYNDVMLHMLVKPRDD